MEKSIPIVIEGVTQTVFSVARHYGGCRINNVNYVYDPKTDRLVHGAWFKVYQAMKYEDFRKVAATGVVPQLPKHDASTKNQAKTPESAF